MANKQAAASKTLSFSPDTFVSGGLATDFDGVVTLCRTEGSWDYNGTRKEGPIFSMRVEIRPDPGQEQFENEEGYEEGTFRVVNHYSAGDLSAFVPSTDGENPTAEENGVYEDGYFALLVGTKTGLGTGSNWAQFIRALLEAEFPQGRLVGDVRFIEGLHAHWARVPQQKRSGTLSGDDGKKRDLLVVTEIKALPPVKGQKAASAGSKPAAPAAAPAKKAAPKPAPVEEAEEVEVAEAEQGTASEHDALDTKLGAIVVSALRASDGTLKKSSLGGKVAGALQGAEKAKGVKRVMDVEFLGSFEADVPGWVYDADSGELTLIDE